MNTQTKRQRGPNFLPQITAMMHIESVFEEFHMARLEKKPIDMNLVERRLWAAHYFVQSMDGGYKPENFDEITAPFPEDQIED